LEYNPLRWRGPCAIDHDGEYIAIENEGFINPESDSTIKTKSTLVANKEGIYNFLNHSVFEGSLLVFRDSEDMVDMEPTFLIFRLNILMIDAVQAGCHSFRILEEVL
jgi:hypothetical protein